MQPKIITISREYGSGGRDIGRRVAETLHIPFYDSEIIRETMKKTGLPEEVIQSAEQRVTSSFLFNIAMGVDITRNYIQQIHVAEKEVILEKIAEGSCVIVGRSANFILQNKVPSVRAFIYADMDSRMKYASEHYGIDVKNVHSVITRSDSERSLYSKNFYNEDWGERTNYDMLLNSALLGIDGCVDLIITAYRKESKEM
ncbi:MAG: cytidylate kinase-like family protein [Lachnospiraceae bacterium]|nr:cytidylate kinase-like family protein [Lachnospiraceae bacterium]